MKDLISFVHESILVDVTRWTRWWTQWWTWGNKMSFSASRFSMLWTGIRTDSSSVNLHLVRMRDEAGALTKNPSDKGADYSPTAAVSFLYLQ